MKKTLGNLLIIGALMASAGGSVATAGPGDVGTPAADFMLQAFGGGTYTLSDYRDKVVLLNIMGYG